MEEAAFPHRPAYDNLGNAVPSGIARNLLYNIIPVKGNHIGPELLGQINIGLHAPADFCMFPFHIRCFHQNRCKIRVKRPCHPGRGPDYPCIGGGGGQADQHMLTGVIILARRIPLPDHLPVDPVRCPP